jgi:hypothetical protein
MPTLQHFLSGALCALVVAAGACKDDEPVNLFDEQGTWALFQYDLDGSGITPIAESERIDQFLINFDAEAGIVSAASCIDSSMQTSITSAFCDLDKWVCRCFNYTFEEARMVWTEFTPEGPPEGYMTPPMPGEDSTASPPGEAFLIDLEAYPETSNTFRYSGLPFGLFDSDGTISRYVFQLRGDVKFIPTGCLQVCGASSPEQMPAES